MVDYVNEITEEIYNFIHNPLNDIFSGSGYKHCVTFTKFQDIIILSYEDIDNITAKLKISYTSKIDKNNINDYICKDTIGLGLSNEIIHERLMTEEYDLAGLL